MGHAKIAAVAILAALMLAAAPSSQPVKPVPIEQFVKDLDASKRPARGQPWTFADARMAGKAIDDAIAGQFVWASRYEWRWIGGEDGKASLTGPSFTAHGMKWNAIVDASFSGEDLERAKRIKNGTRVSVIGTVTAGSTDVASLLDNPTSMRVRLTLKDATFR